MKIKIGISARHVHLTKEHLELLFGSDIELTNFKDLSQPKQYAANEKVTIKTAKNKIENVRILGPVRDYSQVEISKTDAHFLGLNPPVRESGDIVGSEPITLIGPNGSVELVEGCIIASRHIHMHPSDVEMFKIDPSKPVSVLVGTDKQSVLKGVTVKVSSSYKLELHLDTDDANACLLTNSDEAIIVE